MIKSNELVNMMDLLRKDHDVPAIQLGIVRDGETLFAGGSGFRNLKEQAEADEDTVFAIGSATKAFAAESIAILVDEGKVEWDAPVKKYIPELEMYNSYVTENLTVRDILSHRCGLPRHDFMWYFNMDRYSAADIVEKLKYLKPSAPFRYKMQYQNHMYLLAGYMIERVSGKKWSDFVKERILKPLGMNDTNFSVEDTKKLENKALPYEFCDGSIKEMPFKNIDAVGTAGAINSNIKDMLKWVQFNLNKGIWENNRVISEINLTECHTPQMIIRNDMFPWKFTESNFKNYGMGWFIECYRGHEIIHHGGAIDGFESMVALIPEINSGFAILTNKHENKATTILLYSLCDILLDLDPVDWNERFKKEIQKAYEEYEKQTNKLIASAQKNTQTSFDLDVYCGEYENNAYGKFNIEKENDRLLLKWGDLEVFLQHLCFDSFIADQKSAGLFMPLQFRLNITGKITTAGLKCEPALDEFIEFEKLV